MQDQKSKSFYFLLLFSVLITTFTVLPTKAEVHIQGRSYSTSCSYYTKTIGDFLIQYNNYSLPWGTRVFLIYGADGYTVQYGPIPPREIKLNWQNKKEIEVHTFSDFAWGADISLTLHERTNPDMFNGLDFVFRIVLPNGTVYYDNGGASDYGYYVANLLMQGSPCTSSERSLPHFDTLNLEVRP
jgi:hypothetical protein